ncbi:SAM-dependent methyltransferase [Chengkuizengella axinellae]|uniref:SAM-dependent methyltransferase n=1 Tax=Chengkuizengella axinellae TaxID=3064388 RepID=A0ABT9J751_9BACL|nr:SAM-dependent methyltransferase [Chengkuizengella sp. 2205SS18-9]MDP5276794.1 SAM-dependent methyltransferase [Chengkuizengella sp. 2205SS18-9]
MNLEKNTMNTNIQSEQLLDAEQMIISIKPEFETLGMQELKSVDSQHKLITWFDQGIGHIQLSAGFNRLAKHFLDNKPIYIQHVSPIHTSVQLAKKEADLEAILKSVNTISSILDKNKSFSVQSRFIDPSVERPYKRFEVNKIVSEAIKEKGYALHVQKPEQIISIVFFESQAFIGISTAEANLSDWSGGQHRFAQEKDQISRAEFKLLEAMDVFDIQLPEKCTALDLGAAPGGWTRVLLQHNATVYAVDPANLDRVFKKNPKVKHFKETAQLFFKKDVGTKFDIVVNDMRMDTIESVELMGEAKKLLKANSLMILTLKLPKKNVKNRVDQAISTLKKWYEVLGVKQLFHNRSEVTIYMKNRI